MSEQDNLGPVEIEWIIDNDKVAQDLAKTEALYTETVGNIEAAATTAGSAVEKLVAKGGFSDSVKEVEAYAASLQNVGDSGEVALSGTAALIDAVNSDFAKGIITAEEFRTEVARINQAQLEWTSQIGAQNAAEEVQIGLLEQLKITEAELIQLRKSATSVKEIQGLNLALQETQAEMVKYANVGKKGFDEFGQKIKSTGGYLQTAWSGLRTIAQILPGIGIAGLVAFATGPILEYVTALFKGRDALSQAVQNLKAFNEVQKATAETAGKSLGQLKLLYDRTQDVTRSMQDRLDAARQLREEATGEIKNATDLAIVNGDLKKSYDELTESIIANAKSQAAQNKIAQLSGDILNAQMQIQKIKNANAREIAKSKQDEKNGVYDGEGGGILAGENVRKSNERAKAAIAEQNEIIKQRTNTIKELEGYVKNVDDAAKELADANSQLGTNLENFDKALAAATNRPLLEQLQKNLQIKLDALAPSDQQFAEIQNKINKVGEILKKYQPKTDDGKAVENAAAQSLKERAALLAQITEAEGNMNRKQLTEDEAAIKAISDKFDLLRAKITAFNTNPKNKSNQISQDTIDKIQPLEDAAVKDQTEKNNTKALEKELDERKKQYEDYEKYRQELGAAAASVQYGQLLKSGDNFQDYLAQVKAMFLKSSLSPAAFEERKKLFDKFDKDIKKGQSDLNLDMLAATMDFYQQNAVITDRAIREAQALAASGNKKAAAIRLQQGQDELDARVLQQAETLQSYKDLAKNLENVSKAQADLQIREAKAKAKADLDNGKISEEVYKALIALITQAADAIAENTILNGLNAIGDALENVGNSAAALDKNFSSALITIAATIKQVAALSKDIKSLENGISNYSTKKKEAGGGFLGSVSAIADIIPVAGAVISGAVKVVTGVINFFKAAKQTAIQSAQEIERYQQSLITGEVTYNELLRERAAVIKNINDLTAKQLADQQQLLENQTQQAQNDFNRLLALIQGSGQQITGEHTEKYGGFLGIAKKTKVVQDLAGLGGVNYDQLEKLYTEGKLTDSTKAWFEELQKVKDEMGNIADATQEVNDQIDGIFTGTTADSLEQAIIEGLKAGKRGFKDFGDDFKATIQEALTSEFENNVLKEGVAAFYKEFATLAENGNGISTEDLRQLQLDYKNFIDQASGQYADLFKVLGIDAPGTGGSGSGSAAAKISAAITEDTASEVLGTLHGIQLYAAQLISGTGNNGKTATDQLAEMRRQTLLQIEIAANTRRTADNTAILPEMNEYLKAIKGNTKDTTGAILRAAGLTS